MNTTGENEMDLRKILDFTRMASIAILLLHFYFYCYRAFKMWGWSTMITDRLLQHISHTGLFHSIHTSKFLALGLLVISLLGNKGRKGESISRKLIVCYLLIGLLLYWGSVFLFYLMAEMKTIAIAYIAFTSLGYLLILAGGSLLSRLITLRFTKDIFNQLNESFPQEERLLQNEYSINLPAQYNLRGRIRSSWINIINPFRGLLVLGSPSAGKSWFVIQHVIKQHIEKGFSLFVYDFKFDDLTRIAYNWMLQHQKSYSVPPGFYVINFDDLSKSHRCNPLAPHTLLDITDATESSRTILLGLNREWIKRQGDFFVESPINFLTAVIWFLRKYEDGRCCTLPHMIELMQQPCEKLFPVLNTLPEIEVLINPFITTYENDAMEQLEGQVASAKIGMARLSSPQLYWVLSGSDFTLDINNPKAPKIVCMGNNPEKQQTYGAVLSLYVSRMIRMVNKKGKGKCSLIFDEFPTIFFNHIDALIATARSNRVATTLGMQDFSQLRKDYGKEQADVITDITGNIISGQVSGDTARFLSERFWKILQDRESVSVSGTDTTVSASKQLESALPPSRIASLSSGEFVGMVADDPHIPIQLKMFHARIVNEEEKSLINEKLFHVIPQIRTITEAEVMNNYLMIKQQVKKIIEERLKAVNKRFKKEKGEP